MSYGENGNAKGSHMSRLFKLLSIVKNHEHHHHCMLYGVQG